MCEELQEGVSLGLDTKPSEYLHFLSCVWWQFPDSRKPLSSVLFK